MIERIVSIILMILVLVISGCISGLSPEDIAKMSDEVREFLDQYPDSDIAASYLRADYVGGVIDQVREDCGEQMEIADYWRVNVHDPQTNVTLIIFIEAESKQVVCVVKKGGLCTEEWFCSGWSECVNDEQTRICVDLNRCGTTEGKPDEARICAVPPVRGGGNVTEGVVQPCSSDADCRYGYCPMVIGGDTPKCDLNTGRCYCGGECGDGYCDFYERTYGTCPSDCGTSPVKIMEYFIMSFCPFGNQVEEAIEQVYQELKESVVFSPHYVIYYDYRYPDNCMDHYCSLHGIQELHQDVREICVKKYFSMDEYFEFVSAINGQCNLSNADSCWEDAAKNTGLDTEVIETCQNEEGLELLERERVLCDLYGVTGSPTMFINGRKYEGERTAEAFKHALMTWETVCMDRCGDGVCQGGYYPCPETPLNCPQDCEFFVKADFPHVNLTLNATVNQSSPINLTPELVVPETNLTVGPGESPVKLIPHMPPIIILNTT